MPAAPLLIGGPTAGGKSEVALLLAEKFNGEILSVDSMQVYRGLDIGTAKPTAAERNRIVHHLIDVAGLTETFDAARFCELATAACAQIQSRGRRAIFCGGTGLYFKAMFCGLGETPPSDSALRRQLELTPRDELLAELRERDPATFERIDRQNPRRIVRALEVIRLTGKPFSSQRAAWGDESEQPRVVPVLHCLAREPADLRARMEGRVDRMFARGLVEETRQLLSAGLEQNRTAMQAIGYRQVVEHLRGERSLADTVTLVKQRTWQFARRQMTWFRKQGPVDWVNVAPGESAEAVADRLAGTLQMPGLEGRTPEK